jgi:hypothetical protein
MYLGLKGDLIRSDYNRGIRLWFLIVVLMTVSIHDCGFLIVVAQAINVGMVLTNVYINNNAIHCTEMLNKHILNTNMNKSEFS